MVIERRNGWQRAKSRRAVAAALLLVLASTFSQVSSPARVAAQAGAPTPNSAPATPQTAADEEQARGHFRLGRAHYDNGNFAQAAVEFEEAYRISQRAALLYNIYLAYRDASDTRNAAEALRKYLQLVPDVENRGQLESRLAALDRSIADGTAPQPVQQAPVATTTEPAPVEPTPAPEETTPTAPEEATQPAEESGTNLVPWVLMGTGGAMIIGSVITGMITSGKNSELSDAKDKCEKAMNCDSLSKAEVTRLNGLKDSGQTMALVTDVLLFGGIAVAGTGAVLFILDQASGSSSDAAEPDATASVDCGPGACGASMRLRF